MLPGSFSERGHACVRACASGGSAPVPQRRAAQRARAGGQARGERAAARPAGQRGQRVAEAPVQVPGQLALQRRALPRPRARIGLPTLSPGARAPPQDLAGTGTQGLRRLGVPKRALLARDSRQYSCAIKNFFTCHVCADS